MIRKAEAADVPKIVRLLNSSKFLVPISYCKNDAAYVKRFVNHGIAFVYGDVFGVLLAEKSTMNDIFIDDLVVVRSMRGQGIAKALMAHLEEFCRKRKLKAINMLVNVDNARMLSWAKKNKFRKGYTFVFHEKRL